MDIKITCKECGKEFNFTKAERDFYKEKGFGTTPKRCRACRQARKEKYENRE